MAGPFVTPVAESTPFEPNRNPQWGGNAGPSGIVSTETQSAIEEVMFKAPGLISKPTFTFGRSGNLPNNTYLLCDTVPSNISSRVIMTANSVVTKIGYMNDGIGTFTLKIEEHNGVTYTTIGTVSIVASRVGVFTVSFPATTGKALGVSISSGSAKNLVVGMIVTGN